MPVAPTYPGVYVEEIPSGVRTITGVATSVAAFIDYFKRGPTNRAVRVFSFADFEREFGGLDSESEASYAIQQFFLNGGSEAWVVRVVTTGDAVPANNAAAAGVQIGAAVNAGAAALTLTASSEGAWGNALRARVDNKGAAAGEFNLSILELGTAGGRMAIVRQEVFRNLSMTATASNFVVKKVNDPLAGSKLVRAAASGATRPLINGTLSGAHAADPVLPGDPTVAVTISDGVTTDAASVTLRAANGSPLTGAQPLTKVAPALESAIRAAFPAKPAWAEATVSVVGTQLLAMPGGANNHNTISFVDAAHTTDNVLKLIASEGATVNLQEYALGVAAAITDTAQIAGAVGANGALPGAAALIGDLNTKRGIYALEDVDLFNILCIPRAAVLDPTPMQALTAVAETYCEKRRAFFIMDTPPGVDEPQEMIDWLNANATLRHRNAAVYYPRVKIPDPLDEFRLRTVGASGTVAGVYARTDSARGVWKAPAGTDAAVRNVPDLDDVLTDLENGALNPLGINCVRNFPIFGNIVWGARTLDGADQQASEWKYIPVRRVALFIEESLYRGLKWVVFEPNDEPLWAQIRLNVGAFMHTLFRQGAFQGTTPREAYFVKCDKETTTQNDINLGIVNIMVGFAPLKPAEFVIIKLQQMAGQIQV